MAVSMTEQSNKQLSDEQLLALYRGGDKSAFTRLVKRYEGELYSFLVRFLGKPSLAEDVFQEAFLQVYLSADGFDISRRFRPWLYTIAANKARDLLRSRSRRPSVQLTAYDDEQNDGNIWDQFLRDETTPVDILEARQQKELVGKAVGNMNEHLREILILAYFNQMSYKEMAEILRIPLGTVKSRLHGAVASFGKHYKRLVGNEI